MTAFVLTHLGQVISVINWINYKENIHGMTDQTVAGSAVLVVVVLIGWPPRNIWCVLIVRPFAVVTVVEYVVDCPARGMIIIIIMHEM